MLLYKYMQMRDNLEWFSDAGYLRYYSLCVKSFGSW